MCSGWKGGEEFFFLMNFFNSHLKKRENKLKKFFPVRKNRSSVQLSLNKKKIEAQEKILSDDH